MEGQDKKENSFLLGLSITLATILIGLVSYIVYTNSTPTGKSLCEYNGWAYSDKDTFQSADGCNQCICSNGETVCTQMECSTPSSVQEEE